MDVPRGLTPRRAPWDMARSLAPGPPQERRSGAGVGVVIDLARTPGVDVAVGLRRRVRGVAEQLLDRAQVGAGLEQVRGEGMPEPVGVGEEAPQRGGVERPPA